MTLEQQQAHARLLKLLPVRTHAKMEMVKMHGNHLSPKKASKAGRKGRDAAGLVIPEFRRLKK